MEKYEKILRGANCFPCRIFYRKYSYSESDRFVFPANIRNDMYYGIMV